MKSGDRTEKDSVHSLDDVQNTFILLVPRESESDTAPSTDANKDSEEGTPDKKKAPNATNYRLIALGKKRLPDPEVALKAGQEPAGIGGRNSEAIWATIVDIGTDLNEVAKGMGQERYSTKTRGKPTAWKN